MDDVQNGPPLASTTPRQLLQRSGMRGPTSIRLDLEVPGAPPLIADIYRGGNWYYARCEVLGISAKGDRLNSAKAALETAIREAIDRALTPDVPPAPAPVPVADASEASQVERFRQRMAVPDFSVPYEDGSVR